MTDTAPKLTRTIERTTDPDTADDEPRMAHIVYPKEAVAEALILGTPCTALCGHTWVPTRDPLKYPLCEACRQIATGMGWEPPSC